MRRRGFATKSLRFFNTFIVLSSQNRHAFGCAICNNMVSDSPFGADAGLLRGEAFLNDTKEGLTAMRNRTTLLRAQHRLTAPFLRLAAAGRLKLNIIFVMDNRRT